MEDSQYIKEIESHKRAFTIYNLFKTQNSLKEFSEDQKTAFLLIPCFLHTATPKQFGYIDGHKAPSGIHNFVWNHKIARLMEKYLPGESFDLATVEHPAPIEFLSLMGSVGSIAYTDKSDFDFWCCVRDDLSLIQRELLDIKLRRIEEWCMHNLNVEVHFFLTSSESLRNNDFGSVSKESCGTALGKLLKEEYYRGSLLIAGKIPLWWGFPTGYNDDEYELAAHELAVNYPEIYRSFIDIGNVHQIPKGEFLGGGLWQLNKAIGSPFKSILKMALLMEYSDEKSKGVLVATQVKDMVFDKPNAMRFLDPYQNMVDRITNYYANHGQPGELDLMRKCFFLKISPNVYRWIDSPQRAPKNTDAVMVDYCRRWGWTSSDVAKLEEFKDAPLRDAIELKNKCETFMQNSLQNLEKLTNRDDIDLSISNTDRMQMIHRLESVYDESRKRTNIVYAPFKDFVRNSSYTLKAKKKVSGITNWELLKGEHNLKSIDKRFEEKSFLNQSSRFSELMLWLMANGLVHEKTNINSPLKKDDYFQRNMRSLSLQKSHFFENIHVPSFDDADFSSDSLPCQWLICIDMVPTPVGANSEVRNIEIDTPQRQSQNKKSSISQVLKKISVEENELSLKKTDNQVVKRRTSLPIIEKGLTDDELRRYQLRKLRKTDDPLNAWEPKLCLLQNAVVMEKNTWGEYSAHDYQDADWLARLLSRILMNAFEQGLDLHQSVDFFIGTGFYKITFLEQRFKSLLSDILDFFSTEYDLEGDDVRVFYYEKGGWIYTLIQEKKRIHVQSFETWLKAMVSINLLFPNKRNISGFDSWTDQGRFYAVANAMSRMDQVNIYLMDNPETVHLMVIDERGCCSITEFDRENLRVYLPKYIYGVAKSVHKIRSFHKSSPLVSNKDPISVNWVTLDPKGGIHTQDISESAIKVVNRDMHNIPKLNANINAAHIRMFMLQYAYQKNAHFRDKHSLNVLSKIVQKITPINSSQIQDKEDIFLTGITVDGAEKHSSKVLEKMLPASVTGWLNLKLALEDACADFVGRQARSS